MRDFLDWLDEYKVEIIASIVVIAVIVGVVFLCIGAAKEDANEYNNGICATCSAEWELKREEVTLSPITIYNAATKTVSVYYVPIHHYYYECENGHNIDVGIREEE